MALIELLHAMANRVKKPPALEGDFNFLELEHPEFNFTRVPPNDEHGLPCVKAMSPIGEIYVCALPKGPKETPMFSAATYVCTEFEYDGKKGKYCSQPCLEPGGGHYEGVVITTRGEEVVEMTPFAAAAHSQIIAVKEFLQEKEFEQTVGENLMKAFEANLKGFIDDAGLCHPGNEKESNSFLRRIWEHAKSFLGEEKLSKIGRERPYSCESLIKQGYSGFVTSGGHPWSYFVDTVKLLWNPEYDTRELAEKYFELLKKKEIPLGKLTPRDIARIDPDFNAELDEIYYGLEEDIQDRLHQLSCRELVEEGVLWDEEVCERIEELEKWLEEMEKHKPIPGMEEEYEKAKKEYEAELEDIYTGISEAISDYAFEEANRLMEDYLNSSYDELASRALDEDDWAARELKQLMDEYCEKKPYVCEQAYMLSRER